MNLLGSSNMRVTYNNYYLLTPAGFTTNSSQINSISSNGTWVGTGASSVYNIRPAISLVAEMKYSSGDGSTTNPFIVDLNSLNP